MLDHEKGGQVQNEKGERALFILALASLFGVKSDALSYKEQNQNDSQNAGNNDNG